MSRTSKLEITRFAPGRVKGASPSFDQDYILISFDISEPKKYRCLIKTLKSYGRPIQRSVYVAHLRRGQMEKLLESIRNLMGSERFFNADDSVYVYQFAGNCKAVAFGPYVQTEPEENIVL